MNYHIIPVTILSQNCLLIWCEKTRLSAIIDPGGNAEKIKREINNLGLSTISKILLTHGHIDHVGAAAELSRYYNAPVIGPGKEDEFWLQYLPTQSRIFGLEECHRLIPNCWLNESDIVNVGDITLKVFHTPGHTPGHIVFFEEKSRFLISGDVIFKSSIGRSDFPRSDYNKLIDSIKKKLLSLGDNVTFIPGHGPISTIGHERLHNPFLQK